MSKAASALARRRWRNRTTEKVCLFCGQTFLGDKRQAYCTPAHQNAAGVKRFRDLRRAAPRDQGAGRGDGRRV